MYAKPNTFKECATCGDVKPVSEYGRRKDYKDGIRSECKVCHRKRMNVLQKRWLRNRDPEKVKRQEKQKAERQRKRNPEKQRARGRLSKAVQAGRIVKPGRCEDCGRTLPQREIHGHHHDYLKPFDVRWLCARCHADVHLAEREEATDVQA